MADIVNTSVLRNGNRRYVAHFTNESDGTGEAAVVKVDISTLTDANGATATKTVVDRIKYSVEGFNYLVVEWNHTTNDEVAVLRGRGVIDWTDVGGKVDPGSSGGDGDIVFTTDGGADGSMYDITMFVRPKA